MASSSGSSIINQLVALFTHEERPVVGLLMVHTVFGSILVPLLLTLLYFSTPRLRRTPIFWIIFFDVLVGLGAAVWYIETMLSVLFNPLASIPRQTYMAFALIQGLATWVVDASLLFRLVAVFPLTSTPTRKLIGVFVFPALVKAARLALTTAGAVIYAPTLVNVTNASSATTSNLEVVGNPLFIGESACQLADHTYMTCLFLWKLRSGFKGAKDSGRVTDGCHDPVAGRIRTLFFIALGNFVFPVLFNIALIVIASAGSNKLDVVYVFPVNVYMTVIGVVFATVWNSAHRMSSEVQPAPPPSKVGLPPLAFKHSFSTGLPAPSREVEEHRLEIVQRI